MSGSDLVSLVTGGAGFIGSHVVDALLERGATVRVADNLLTGSLGNLAHVRDRIEFVEADLSDPDAAARVCRGVDVIYHVAALPSVPLSVEAPLETHRHGMTATVNLLAAARDAGVRRVVYSSSSSVYGGGERAGADGRLRPQREDDPPRPRSPYAASKVAGEAYVRAFAETSQTDGVSLRYFNVYGPRQSATSRYAAVFPAFITRMLRGERPVIFGDGRQTRDFTYVEDVARANLLAGARPGPLRGEALNIGAGRQTSLLDLAAAINRLLGTTLAPGHEAERAGDVRASLADIERAREQIGYEPEIGLDEGLRRTIAWFRDAGGRSAGD